MYLPAAFWVITLFMFGIATGSFLTAVIYRLARPGMGLSLLEPVRSMCPNCKHSLGALDLVPLFSFLLFGQKCRYCKQPISWRYFGVELLTGLTFVALYFKFPLASQDFVTSQNLMRHNAPILAASLLFAATLIPIFFIDLETFTIPVSLTLLATVIPVALDAWEIARHQAGFELLWGWMPRSVLGGIIGLLIFGGVRVAGWLYKGVEAMGLGDVYLARGMGAMLMVTLPPGLSYWPFPLWVILSCVSGIAVYPLFVAVRRRAETKKSAKESKDSNKTLDRYGNSLASGETTGAEAEETWEREGSLLEQLRDVGAVLIGYDAWEWTRYTFDRKFRERVEAEIAALPAEEEWTPAPTAIPFGPFLVIGFLLTLFFGQAMILAYLSYAHLSGDKPPPNS